MNTKTREKTESIARTFEKYQMKLALLQQWENCPDADPEYLSIEVLELR